MKKCIHCGLSPAIKLCTHCGSSSYIKYGKHNGYQRYKCKDCNRSFSDKIRKFTYADKEKCIEYILNNVGIRKAALFIGCSPPQVLRWIKERAMKVKSELEQAAKQLSADQLPEIIEMDEIYTRVKKGGNRLPVWTSFARRRGKIVAFVIGTESSCAIDLYNKTNAAVGDIRVIYTDGNSSYSERFKEIGISNKHIVSKGKSETHLIESVNSSIRDNIASFNRKTKRFTKSKIMLEYRLLLFFDKKKYKTTFG
jgi:IS1 family transposase/transposase-like protein